MSLSHLRKVGVPSMQDTMGLFSPPFSKSCAEIFLTGVLLPPLDVDFEPVDRDLAGGERFTAGQVLPTRNGLKTTRMRPLFKI